MQSDAPQTDSPLFPAATPAPQAIRWTWMLGVFAFLLTPSALPVAILLESNSNPAWFEQALVLVASGLLLPFSLAQSLAAVVLAIQEFIRYRAVGMKPGIIVGLVFGLISLAFSLLYSVLAVQEFLLSMPHQTVWG